MRNAGETRGGGFTLVELMVVVAIVAVLVSMTLVAVSSTTYAKTPRGFADQISAMAETAHQRAVANNRWQQLEITTDGEVIHWESTSVGMGTPAGWDRVGSLAVPSDIEIASTDDRAHDQTDDSPPSPGTFSTRKIHFAPDGTLDASSVVPSGDVEGATIFIRDTYDKQYVRVALFPVTGAAYALNEW